jgi:hypothetical protein
MRLAFICIATPTNKVEVHYLWRLIASGFCVYQANQVFDLLRPPLHDNPLMDFMSTTTSKLSNLHDLGLPPAYTSSVARSVNKKPHIAGFGHKVAASGKLHGTLPSNLDHQEKITSSLYIL